MLNKKEVDFSFADVALNHAQRRWEMHWLKRVLDLVDWKPFDRELSKLYSPDEGRPAWSPVVLFRCLLLAEWNSLSDRQLEEAIEFRFDFRRFAGIALEQEAPDATTFVVFRGRVKHLHERLLSMLNEQLKRKGFAVHKAVAVDATLVEAHSKPSKKDQGKSGDSDASWRGFPVKKTIDKNGKEVISRRMALYGYKVNISTSVDHGFVGAFSVCGASEHESRHFRRFITPDTLVVYADKGYVGQRSFLAERKLRDGIQAKATRGHALSFADISRNKRITVKRRIVEGVFGSWKQWYGWRKTRFMGLMKNELAVCLTALAWNMKKLAKLTVPEVIIS